MWKTDLQTDCFGQNVKGNKYENHETDREKVWFEHKNMHPYELGNQQKVELFHEKNDRIIEIHDIQSEVSDALISINFEDLVLLC